MEIKIKNIKQMKILLAEKLLENYCVACGRKIPKGYSRCKEINSVLFSSKEKEKERISKFYKTHEDRKLIALGCKDLN